MVKNEYEMILILDGSSKEDLDKTQENIKTTLDKKHIEVVQHDDWGKQKLFHAIDKLEMGVYHFFHIRSDRSIIQSLEADLRVFSGVLKTFVTRKV